MLLALDDRRTELLLRAVRDHLADLGTTLPALLERDEAVSLHFWFAGYDGVRRQPSASPTRIAPGAISLGTAALARACTAGERHFRRGVAEQALGLWRE